MPLGGVEPLASGVPAAIPECIAELVAAAAAIAVADCGDWWILLAP